MLYFKLVGGYGMAIFNSLWLNLPHRLAEPSDEILFPGLPHNCRVQLAELPHDIKSATAPIGFLQNG